MTRSDLLDAIAYLLERGVTCPQVAAAVIRTLVLLVCLASTAGAETLDITILANHHIGVRSVAQPTLLDLVTSTPAYLRNRPAEKPLRITGLDKPHTSGLRYVGSGGWSTR